MPRYKCRVEYEGTHFSGWQKQKDVLTIQGCIESAIHAFCGENVTIFTAGRTDAGVHAWEQVFHCDLERYHPEERIKAALNFYLREHPVAILSVETVDEQFHARFSAIRRHYQYHILNRRTPPALEHSRVWHLPVVLNEMRMREAANLMLGTHDFTSFRDSQCQAKSPVRTLDSLTITREGERILIQASAKSFLHHMVRNIVGTLVLIGENKHLPDYITTILEARDRRIAGPTAPPWGLYFMRVDY